MKFADYWNSLKRVERNALLRGAGHSHHYGGHSFEFLPRVIALDVEYVYGRIAA